MSGSMAQAFAHNCLGHSPRWYNARIVGFLILNALVLATLFFVADAMQVVAAQANRAAGDVWWPTIMHFVSYTAIMMPLGWWLAHRIGVDGLVWSVIVASLVSAALLTGRFVRVARRLPA